MPNYYGLDHLTSKLPFHAPKLPDQRRYKPHMQNKAERLE